MDVTTHRDNHAHHRYYVHLIPLKCMIATVSIIHTKMLLLVDKIETGLLRQLKMPIYN